MAKPAKQQPARASLFTKVLLLVLLAAVAWQLHNIQGQVDDALVQQELLRTQVQLRQQENDALAADIAAGSSPEKMEDLARDELGLVGPNEYVFYDVSN